MKTFNTDKIESTSEPMFFGKGLSIARFDKQRYPIFEKLTQQQLGYFWRPEEVDLSGDSKDFKKLNDSEKHIFVSNLKRQILLDSVQGRAPIAAFLPIVSLPELENWIVTWSFFETIHSRSYTHILRNIYSNPTEVFDSLLDIREISDCANSITKHYDNLIESNHLNINDGAWDKDLRDKKLEVQKENLWLCLNAVNALEGIRFYVSFACSWAFAELKRMEGNAKIIKFIARDENIHLASTQHLLKLLPKEDTFYSDTKVKYADTIRKIFIQVVEQEKMWAKYLFKDGSMIGLNEQLLCEYVEWIAHKRMQAIGIDSPYKGGSNPLPWTQKWISGSEVQVAPQETEISSYIVGGIKKDVDENSFKGFKL